MDVFLPILNKMIFLMAFIAIGFILSKWKFVPDDSVKVLSKLENMIFMPALVMGVFIKNCSVSTLAASWNILLAGLIFTLVFIPISIFFARLCFKDEFLRKIGTYGLAFSNFAFMGNAIMEAIFPEYFFGYTIFTLPVWCGIYLWGAPVLLIGDGNGEGKKSFASRMKSFVNPMLIGLLIGMVIGLIGLELPSTVMSVIETSGSCMSPVAMILTGMTIARIDLLALLKKWRIYAITAVKLLVYPLLFILVFAFVPQGSFFTPEVLTCAMCLMCMPMGLNSIVIPAAYGKDTTDAAGMALITHVFSVITIPLLFTLFQYAVL